MKVLIAPDKFKGCLTADEVASEIAAGIRDVLPTADIDLMPIADGGEGTAEVIRNALGGSWVTCQAHDPFGRQIECRYAFIEGQRLAVMEMSEAAGMRRIKKPQQNPLRATTFGVGQLILHATRRGAEAIIVGLGGSATNDGGFGMARALGFRFFDRDGAQIRSAVNKLQKLKRVEKPTHLAIPSITAVADVRNPLLGRHGATRVFGPQKGVTPGQLPILEKALKRFARVAIRQIRRVDPKAAGAGAAGGLGFGLMVFAGAQLRPGFEVVAEYIKAAARIRAADVVVTGEGRLDSQTLQGKGPAEVARLARKHQKPVFALVGQVQDRSRIGEVFEAIYELGGGESDNQLARHLLRLKAREMAIMWCFMPFKA